MGKQLIALAASLLLSANALADVEAEETFSFTLDNGGRFSLENVNGSVTVEGGSGNEVNVIAYKKANNQKALDGIEILIDASESSIRIETKHPKSTRGWWGGDNDGARVSYVVELPASANLDSVESVNGDVEITGVYGNVSAETVNGSVEVEDLSGDANLETVNGSVNARFTSLTGDQRVKMDAVNGRLTLYLPANADASVKAETVNGSIDGKDFDLVTNKGFVGKDLDGEIGNGSARVTLDTVNGSIKIRKN